MTPNPSKRSVRVDSLKRLLKLAEEYGLEELSFQGTYIKRGGPPSSKVAAAKPKSQRPAEDEQDDLAEIDAANEPIMKAFKAELGG